MKRTHFFATAALNLVLLVTPLSAQTCASSAEMDAATKSALETAGQQFFTQAARGDVAAMRQNAVPSLASNFSAVETAVKDNAPLFQGAQATVRGVYLLDAPGTAVFPRAEFYCGIFNSPDRVGFAIPNLPPGRYAVVIENLTGGKTSATLALVLQQQNGWKLAGFYAKSDLVAGHDGQWYLSQARQYKSAGQIHNAWFYYLVARDLLAPVPFMSTPKLDQLYDESQGAKPSDIPPASPLTISVSVQEPQTYNVDQPGKQTQQVSITKVKVFTVTQMFAVPIADGLDIVAKYETPSVANTAQTYADNMALIKALVTKYPELRQAFAGVVVRATDPSGGDYGTLLAMKDVK